MAPTIVVLLTALHLLQPCLAAYTEFYPNTVASETLYMPFDHIPMTYRPYQVPDDVFLQHVPGQSMVTAVAPMMSAGLNGTHATSYSIHYHDYFVKTRKGRGIFKRGVFASDPIQTCTPCGTLTSPISDNTALSSSCTLVPYTVSGG